MTQLIKYRLKDKPLAGTDIAELEKLRGLINESKILNPKDYLLKKTEELIA
jgi:hypothetical protein